MLVFEDLLTGDELLSDSFPYREIENGMLWEVDGKWVVQGAIHVDIGANPSAEGGEDEGVDDQAVKVVDFADSFRLQCVVQGAIHVDIGANPSGRWWLIEGTPLKSSGYGENWHKSKMFALVAPQSLPPGDVSSSSTGTPVLLLWLDSGAAIHVVGDAKILTNLRDPPTKMAVTVADGFQLPITKVGVIQAPNINISDVCLAPGLKMNLVSVRQLAKSKIVTIFYENYAELWLDGERIGGAIFDNHVSLYRLCFFKPHA